MSVRLRVSGIVLVFALGILAFAAPFLQADSQGAGTATTADSELQVEPDPGLIWD